MAKDRKAGKMAKKSPKESKKALDKDSGKRGPGRPGVEPSVVYGRAGNYRYSLEQIWGDVSERLLKATTREEVIEAFQGTVEYYSKQFIPVFANLILQILHEPNFPTKPKTQIKFIAESLGGADDISPRRSRDICAAEREKLKLLSPHNILRKEFYVECSCGYEGPALNNACRECKAVIPQWLESGNSQLFGKTEE